MTVYIFNGGGFVTASTPTEFVEKMRESSLFGRSDDTQEFMDQVAHRCYLDRHAEIRLDNAEVFLSDLISNDFVIPIKTE